MALVFYFLAVDAKNAVSGVASRAAAGAQRMAGLEPRQGTACLLTGWTITMCSICHPAAAVPALAYLLCSMGSSSLVLVAIAWLDSKTAVQVLGPV